jgi:hypothetical protein
MNDANQMLNANGNNWLNENLVAQELLNTITLIIVQILEKIIWMIQTFNLTNKIIVQLL